MGSLEDAVLEVVGEELALGVVAREAERGLREVVRAEREEVGVLGDLVGPDARARELDHRAARGSSTAGSSAATRSVSSRRRRSSSREADERMHDLDERRLARALLDGERGAHDRAHLHLVDLGNCRPSRQPRVPSIGFDSCSARMRRRIALVGRLLERRQELVQRRVEQADRHRQPAIASKIPSKSACWNGSSRSSAARRLALGRGHDHLLHDRQPLLGHEHVLGAAEADPLGAELARLGGVLRRVGVGADPEAAELVGPVEDRLEVSLIAAARARPAPTMTRPVPPSIVIVSPS